jgi:hypothetical protein
MLRIQKEMNVEREREREKYRLLTKDPREKSAGSGSLDDIRKVVGRNHQYLKYCK